MKKRLKIAFMVKTTMTVLVAGGLALGSMGSQAADEAAHADAPLRYRVVLNDGGKAVQSYTTSPELRKPHAYTSTTKAGYRKAWDGKAFQLDVVETGLRVTTTPVWQSPDGTAMLHMNVEYDDPADIRPSDTTPPLDLVETRGFDCQITVMVPPGGEPVAVCGGGSKVLIVQRVVG